MSPLVGFLYVEIKSRIVDLPAPDGPTIKFRELL